MKLNPDCTRAILLAVEECCDISHIFSTAEDIHTIKGDFSRDEILYHIRQCDLSGMFYNCKSYVSGEYVIVDLSPKGHEFLANIRSDTIWENVKAVATKVGAKSLSAISQIAISVVSEIIRAQILPR